MARDKTVHRLIAALLAAPLVLAAAPPTRLAQAIETQRMLVAQGPDNAAALNDLGNLLVESGEPEQAEETYRQAMAVDPGRPEPPFNLALLLAAQHRRREARRVLKALLEDHPDHAWGHYQLGTLRHGAGKRGKALQSYREAFRLDPSLSDPRRNPHVLDNPLTTAAMLEAFAMLAPASTRQRIYVERSRITGLLLPSLTAMPPMGDGEPSEDSQPMEEAAPDAPPAEEMPTQDVGGG